MIWHYKHNRIDYYLQEGQQKLSKRYTADDLKRFPQFLSFQTSDSPAQWFATATDLRQMLASVLAHAGYETDLNTDPNDPDWVFYATDAGEPFLVVLVLAKESPCTWVIGLERCPARRHLAVMTLFETTLAHYSTASGIRSHAHHRTLPRPR
jgi:hypothetical protein